MLDSWMVRQPAIRRAQSNAARTLYHAGVRPNYATAVGGILGVLAGIAFALGSITAGIILLALSGALDALDGSIAREFEAPTRLGGILDLTIDRVVEVAVLLGLIWQYPALEFPGAVVLATWYVNITAFMATGAAVGTGEKLIHYPPGLVERTEALVFFVVLALVPFGRRYICYGYAALEIATTIQRVLYASRHLAGERPS